MNLQDTIKVALADFMKTDDETTLLSIIHANPEVISPFQGDYPDTHRIADIVVGNKIYRVCRQISAGEKITFDPIDAVMREEGVPLWLTGDKLRSWAADEAENPSDEPTVWENFK